MAVDREALRRIEDNCVGFPREDRVDVSRTARRSETKTRQRHDLTALSSIIAPLVSKLRWRPHAL